jgi:mRNA-degrading endonuclease toxin of MazEF toxin-antitoxin module
MVMAGSYVPDAGDIVWVSFNPQAGREQAGHRPAVVLSPAAYNAKTSLMVCGPMTTQITSVRNAYIRLSQLLQRKGRTELTRQAICSTLRKIK